MSEDTIKVLLIRVGEKPELIDVERSAAKFRGLLQDDIDFAFGSQGTYVCREWALFEDPLNETATALWWELQRVGGDSFVFPRAPLHGPVIITGPVRGEDETAVSLETAARAEYHFTQGLSELNRESARKSTAQIIGKPSIAAMYKQYGSKRKENR